MILRVVPVALARVGQGIAGKNAAMHNAEYHAGFVATLRVCFMILREIRGAVAARLGRKGLPRLQWRLRRLPQRAGAGFFLCVGRQHPLGLCWHYPGTA
jgi:hypothetical protein